MIHLKSANEIEILRECNQIVAVILNTLKKHCQPGITTLELDKIAEDPQRDFYFSSQEAKEYGIIDEVMQNRKLKAV